MLKSDIEFAVFRPIDEGVPFVVECDASETTLSATLNQGGRPVAFMPRTCKAVKCTIHLWRKKQQL